MHPQTNYTNLNPLFSLVEGSTRDLLPHVVSTHIISHNFLSQQKVIEVLFILDTGVVIQLNHWGKQSRKGESQSNLDLLHP